MTLYSIPCSTIAPLIFPFGVFVLVAVFMICRIFGSSFTYVLLLVAGCIVLIDRGVTCFHERRTRSTIFVLRIAPAFVLVMNIAMDFTLVPSTVTIFAAIRSFGLDHLIANIDELCCREPIGTRVISEVFLNLVPLQDC